MKEDRSLLKMTLVVFALLLVAIAGNCILGSRAESDEYTIPIDKKGGGTRPDPGGSDTTGWAANSPLGPWMGTIFPGGFLIASDCITDSGLFGVEGSVFINIVWESSEVDSGHVRWDETGNTTWNYVEETGADSTEHFVTVVPLTADYVGYDFSVRTGSAGCFSEWSDVITAYTTCGDNSVSSTEEENAFFENWLRVDPVYKNKVTIRFKKTEPIPDGGWTTSALIGSFSTTEKSWSISTDPNSTYTWEYMVTDPCGESSNWVAVGTFTTDGSGDIE